MASSILVSIVVIVDLKSSKYMVVIIGQSALHSSHTSNAALSDTPRHSTGAVGASERRLVWCDHGQMAHLTRMNKSISSPAPVSTVSSQAADHSLGLRAQDGMAVLRRFSVPGSHHSDQ